MAYTSKTKVDALFGITMNQTLFDSLLASVKAFIDRYCGKTFESASSDKYYDGSGANVLNVDSFHGSPTVLILTSEGNTEATLVEGQSEDFVTAPYNSSEKAQIVLNPNGRYSRFPNRQRAVKITATFGFSAAVPSDIELAATRLIGSLATNPQESMKTDESLGDYAVSFGEIDQNAKTMGINDILASYRDIDI